MNKIKTIFSKINYFLDKILLSKWLYLITSGLFITVFAFIFKWGTIVEWHNPNYIVDNELLGTFGDFVGGVLGTIFTLISILLVVKTFLHQQTVTKDNQEQQKTQQFNNLFFELLHLYQSEVKELNGENEMVIDTPKRHNENNSVVVKTEQIQYTNKDFFDEEKKKIQNKYRHLTSYEDNSPKAINYYMLFYTNNRSKIAAYFRTLYRIFELIDMTSLISERQKKEYAKIIRAQLTESELFFIRYNALTIYGHQFIEYLNKYHVLKHLPAFELLEFKNWWKNLNNLDRDGINIIFLVICESLKEVFKNGLPNEEYKIDLFPIYQSRFKIILILRNKSDFIINLTIDQSIDKFTNEFYGLHKMEGDWEQIQLLLDCFIKEIFLYSNFNRYNIISEIETYSSPIITKDSVIEIKSGIKNINNKPLLIRDPNLCLSTK